MKLVRRFSCLLVLALAPAFPLLGQQALPTLADTPPAAVTPGAPAVPAKPLTPEQLARQKLKEEKEKVHQVAVMELKIGGGSPEQLLIELLPESAPNTVSNFVKNSKNGVYNGLAFHRAIKDYLVQTGDPASKDPNARDKWGLTQQYTIPPEIKLPNIAGAVAMARRSDKVNPDMSSDGTQFYIVVGNLRALDGKYTVFGKVVSGMEIVKRISELPVDSNDCPLPRVEILHMTITQQSGPLVTLLPVGKKKRQTKPEVLKSSFEKFIERIW